MTEDEAAEIKFAMGYVIGRYANENQCPSLYGNDLETGPNEEMAISERYAVFYRNGTFTFTYPREDRDEAGCDWFSQIPQGFSCGLGVTTTNHCVFDQFVPTPCSEVILKVATMRSCKDGDFGNDCFDMTNWT